MINFDKILNIVAVMVALLAILLFSGGIWELKTVGDLPIRMNKITGSTEYGYIGEWKPIK